MLSTALNEAVGRDLLTRNVTHRAAIPRYSRPEIEPLTVDEAQRVIAQTAA